jgi:hypothetical protein
VDITRDPNIEFNREEGFPVVPSTASYSDIPPLMTVEYVIGLVDFLDEEVAYATEVVDADLKYAGVKLPEGAVQGALEKASGIPGASVVGYASYLASITSSTAHAGAIASAYQGFNTSVWGNASVLLIDLLQMISLESSTMRKHLLTSDTDQNTLETMVDWILGATDACAQVVAAVQDTIVDSGITAEMEAYPVGDLIGSQAYMERHVVEQTSAASMKLASLRSIFGSSYNELFYSSMSDTQAISVESLTEGVFGTLVAGVASKEHMESLSSIDSISSRFETFDEVVPAILDSVKIAKLAQNINAHVVSLGGITASEAGDAIPASPDLEVEAAMARGLFSDISEPSALAVYEQVTNINTDGFVAVEEFNLLKDHLYFDGEFSINGGDIRAGTLEVGALKVGDRPVTLDMMWGKNQLAPGNDQPEQVFHLSHSSGTMSIEDEGSIKTFAISAAEVTVGGIGTCSDPNTAYWVYARINPDTMTAVIVAYEDKQPADDDLVKLGMWITDTNRGRLITSYGTTVIMGNEIVTSTLIADIIAAHEFVLVGGAAADVNAGSVKISAGAIVVEGSPLVDVLNGKSKTYYTNTAAMGTTTTPRNWDSSADASHVGDIWYDEYHGHILIFAETTGGYDWKSVQGIAGADGQGVEVQYSANNNGPWETPFNAATHNYMHLRIGTGGYGAAMRIVGEKGDAGTDGTYMDIRFKASNSDLSGETLTGENPAGWSDSPPPGTTPIWMSKIKKNAADDTIVAGETWSDPVKLTGGKGDTGSAGASAAAFSIDNSSLIFRKAFGATAPTPNSIRLTTSYQNITSITKYEWTKDGNPTVIGSLAYYDVPKDDFLSTTSHYYTCTITGTVNSTPGRTLSDTVTVVRLDDGASTATAILSNENISFPGPNTGFAGIDFSSGACDITAYVGTTQLPYNATALTPNSFSCSVAASKATTHADVAAGSGSGSKYTVPAPTDMDAVNAWANVTVTLRDATGATLATIVKKITYSLSRKGPQGVAGPNFQSSVEFYSSGTADTPTPGTVKWTSGNIYFSDGSGPIAISASAPSYIESGAVGTKAYIYFDSGTYSGYVTPQILRTTSLIATACGPGCFLLAIVTKTAATSAKPKITVVAGNGTTTDGADFISGSIIARAQISAPNIFGGGKDSIGSTNEGFFIDRTGSMFFSDADAVNFLKFSPTSGIEIQIDHAGVNVDTEGVVVKGLGKYSLSNLGYPLVGFSYASRTGSTGKIELALGGGSWSSVSSGMKIEISGLTGIYTVLNGMQTVLGTDGATYITFTTDTSGTLARGLVSGARVEGFGITDQFMKLNSLGTAGFSSIDFHTGADTDLFKTGDWGAYYDQWKETLPGTIFPDMYSGVPSLNLTSPEVSGFYHALVHGQWASRTGSIAKIEHSFGVIDLVGSPIEVSGLTGIYAPLNGTFEVLEQDVNYLTYDTGVTGAIARGSATSDLLIRPSVAMERSYVTIAGGLPTVGDPEGSGGYGRPTTILIGNQRGELQFGGIGKGMSGAGDVTENLWHTMTVTDSEGVSHLSVYDSGVIVSNLKSNGGLSVAGASTFGQIWSTDGIRGSWGGASSVTWRLYQSGGHIYVQYYLANGTKCDKLGATADSRAYEIPLTTRA